MPRLLVRSFAMSIDGFSAGPDQDRENPLGVRGPELMEWLFSTRMCLLRDLDLRALGYACDRHVAGERATHVFLTRSA